MMSLRAKVLALAFIAGIIAMAMFGFLLMRHHDQGGSMADCAPYGPDFCVFSSGFQQVGEYLSVYRGIGTVAAAVFSLVLFLVFLFSKRDTDAKTVVRGITGLPSLFVFARNHDLTRWLSLHEKRDPALA